MKIVSTSFREREVFDGCLFQRGRISVRLSRAAMRRFVSCIDELRKTFELKRLTWLRYERAVGAGMNPDGTPKLKAVQTICIAEAEYEISFIGTGEMQAAGDALLTWISTVGRLVESTTPAASELKLDINLHSLTTHPRNPRGELGIIFGMGNIA